VKITEWESNELSAAEGVDSGHNYISLKLSTTIPRSSQLIILRQMQ